MNVPEGEHSIRFVNTGTDWVEVNQYQFDPVTILALKGYGYEGSEKAFGFIKDGTYGQWSDPSRVLTGSWRNRAG